MYKHILLDWDGCLADTLSVWMKGYIETFKKFNLKPTEKQIVGTAFGDYNGPIKLGLDDKYIEEFFNELNTNIKTELLNVALHKDVYEVLEKIYVNGIKMALVTSSKRDTVEPALISNKINQYMEFILDADDVTNHKPDPEIVEKAIAKLRSDKNHTLIVSDSSKDILAGKNAGIDTLVFYPQINQRFYKREELENLSHTYINEDFSKLLHLLEI